MKQNATKKPSKSVVVSPSTGLTALQERCAVLLASGIRLTDVARQVGASRCTLYRWQGQEAFKCFYNLMKQDVKNYVEGSVLGLHTQALEGMKTSLASDNETIRLKASTWVLDKVAEMEVGATDIRQVLKEGCKEVSAFNWEAYYEKELRKAGLDP